MLQAVPKTAGDPEAVAFDDFWLLYPKRLARKDALKAWSKLTEADRMACLVALVDWRRVWAARGDSQFTPHAATWLNGERWTDEVPEEFKQRVAHASHVPFGPSSSPESGPYIPMPEAVRALLAKMKKQ